MRGSSIVAKEKSDWSENPVARGIYQSYIFEYSWRIIMSLPALHKTFSGSIVKLFFFFLVLGRSN